jgi:hypothetical protein
MPSQALLAMMAFWATFLLGLDIRFGMAAIIATTVIDWLFVGRPFILLAIARIFRDEVAASTFGV